MRCCSTTTARRGCGSRSAVTPSRATRTLAGVALREAHEESGLTDLDFDPVPLDLDEHEVLFCAPGTKVHHLDVRFLATAARDADHRVSEESLDVRWWPVDALPEIYPDMRRLIGDAVARLGGDSVKSASTSECTDARVDGVDHGHGAGAVVVLFSDEGQRRRRACPADA